MDAWLRLQTHKRVCKSVEVRFKLLNRSLAISDGLFWLSDEHFLKLQPLLPTDTRGKAHVDDRRVISGIIHVLKSGGRWIDAPEVYGPRKTLYNRFVRWSEKGVWTGLFDTLSQTGGPVLEVMIASR